MLTISNKCRPLLSRILKSTFHLYLSALGQACSDFLLFQKFLVLKSIFQFHSLQNRTPGLLNTCSNSFCPFNFITINISTLTFLRHSSTNYSFFGLLLLLMLLSSLSSSIRPLRPFLPFLDSPPLHIFRLRAPPLLPKKTSSLLTGLVCFGYLPRPLVLVF